MKLAQPAQQEISHTLHPNFLTRLYRAMSLLSAGLAPGGQRADEPIGFYEFGMYHVQESLSKWGMPLKYNRWFSQELFSKVCEQHALRMPAIAFILLFDDYNAFGRDPNHRERKALAEFEAPHPRFRKKHLLSFGPYGEAFQIVAVQDQTALRQGTA